MYILIERDIDMNIDVDVDIDNRSPYSVRPVFKVQSGKMGPAPGISELSMGILK